MAGKRTYELNETTNPQDLFIEVDKSGLSEAEKILLTSLLIGLQIKLDTSGFSGNLDASVVDVQKLANSVDQLVIGGGTGNVDGAANIGTSGTGIFKQLSNKILEFYKLNDLNGEININLNAGENRIDFSINSIDKSKVGLSNVTNDEQIIDGGSGIVKDGQKLKLGTKELTEAVNLTRSGIYENSFKIEDGLFLVSINQSTKPTALQFFDGVIGLSTTDGTGGQAEAESAALFLNKTTGAELKFKNKGIVINYQSSGIIVNDSDSLEGFIYNFNWDSTNENSIPPKNYIDGNFVKLTSATEQTLDSSLKVTKQAYSQEYNQAWSAAPIFNFENGNVQTSTVNSNATIDISNFKDGGNYQICLLGATGTFTVDFSSNFDDIDTDGGETPPLTINTGDKYIISIVVTSLFTTTIIRKLP